MSNIIIPNPQKTEQIIKNIIADGADNLHILTDFDATLTQEHVDGVKMRSLISVLRDYEGYLSEDYRQLAHEMFNHYHPMERDPNLSWAEKKVAMSEWWQKHLNLLITSGLKKNHLEMALKQSRMRMREGAREFFEMTMEKNIPIVIMSASGIGDAISIFLTQQDLLFSNVYTIINSFRWDESGRAVGFNLPIIHSYNKDEAIIADYPFYDKIKDRTNAILMGDGLGDVGMAHGAEHQNLLKIGFFNEPIVDEKLLEVYKESFDVVLMGDGGLEYVNGIVENF